MKDLLNILLTNFIIACIIAVFSTSIICYIYNAFIRPFIKRKMLVKAKSAGHEVIAKRMKTAYPKGSDNGKYNNKIKGFYQYEYNGKLYKHSVWESGIPPREKYLYFRSNPAKATEEIHFGKIESEWIPIFIGNVIVVLIILSV